MQANIIKQVWIREEAIKTIKNDEVHIKSNNLNTKVNNKITVNIEDSIIKTVKGISGNLANVDKRKREKGFKWRAKFKNHTWKGGRATFTIKGKKKSFGRTNRRIHINKEHKEETINQSTAHSVVVVWSNKLVSKIEEITINTHKLRREEEKGIKIEIKLILNRRRNKKNDM